MDLGVVSKPKCLFAVPSVGKNSTYWTASVMGTVWPTMTGWEFRFAIGLEVGRARNLLIYEAQRIGAKYIVFLDEDVLPPADWVKRLLARVDWNPEISVVSGIYGTKSNPPEPLVYQSWGEGPSYDWKVGEFFPALLGSMGCSIVRIKDLEKLEAEEYEDVSPWTKERVKLKAYFSTGSRSDISPTGVRKEWWTEDAYFGWLLQKAGLKFYVDSNILCYHLDSDANPQIYYYLPMEQGIGKRPDAWAHEPRTLMMGQDVWLNPFTVSYGPEKENGFRGDYRTMPPDWTEQFDSVSADRIINRYPYSQWPEILNEWLRILKPGGVLEINCPNLKWAAKEITEGRFNIDVWAVIYGAQDHPLWNPTYYPTFSYATATPEWFVENIKGCKVEVEEKEKEFLVKATKEVKQDGS